MVEQTDPGGGGGGGGSTTIVCTPSPSDEVAILHNLISRISDIERFLAQLVGADVQANNLAELATDMGNLLNGTITLPNSPNSPYGPGGSIPVPPDFNGTVISGNVITTWTNGVVSFQVIPGTGVTVGGAVFKWAQLAILATDNTITAINELVDTDNIVSASGSTITIAQSGLYLFALDDTMGISHTGAAYGFMQVADPTLSLPGQAVVAEAGFVITGNTSGTKYAHGVGTSTVTTIPSGSFSLTASATKDAGTWTHVATLSILKLM